MSNTSRSSVREADRELVRHVCRLCDKSFACGRSLGGHMRSHMINSPDHSQKMKLSSLNNNGGKSIDGGGAGASSNSNDLGYELRKDPKKTLKAKDSNEIEIKNNGLIVLDKLCKECGKGFQSWKALFGHMKCHSDKVSNKHTIQDSWTGQSDYENSKKSKSRKGKVKSCLGTPTAAAATTTASSSISINANNASTSVVSEIDQEQEVEVAMCLMMLSRDVRKWGDEFDSSAFLTGNGTKMKSPAKTQVGIDFLGRSDVGFDGFDKIMVKSFEFDDQKEFGFGKFQDSNKRKFECTACNKSFHSYQALGGHKASHKKLKGAAFDPKIDAKNTIENQPMFDHEHTIHGFLENSSEIRPKTSNFNLATRQTQHECRICSRVFSSGQALGGHKRSHMIAEAKLSQQTEKYEKPVREIRGFLDLNMPPEEEETDSCTTGYKSWFWADSSGQHNHESTLLGLFSTS